MAADRAEGFWVEAAADKVSEMVDDLFISIFTRLCPPACEFVLRCGLCMDTVTNDNFIGQRESYAMVSATKLKLGVETRSIRQLIAKIGALILSR